MRIIRITAWMLGGLLALAGTGCQKEDAEPEVATVEVAYNQTYCADAWGQARTPQELETVAGAYLQQQGITTLTLKATPVNTPSICNACTCKSGVVLEAKVHASQLPALQALGFTQI